MTMNEIFNLLLGCYKKVRTEQSIINVAAVIRAMNNKELSEVLSVIEADEEISYYDLLAIICVVTDVDSKLIE